MEALDLHTSTNTSGINASHIDQNWEDIEAFSIAVVSALTTGAVVMTSISIEDGLFKVTLSNGNSMTTPMPGIMPSIKGQRVEGIEYTRGDFVTDDGTAYVVIADHVAAENVEDDIDTGNVMLFVAKGAAGDNGAPARPRVERFDALGTVTGGSRIIGQHVMPWACRMSAEFPVLAALTSPINPGASSFFVLFKKVSPAGVVTDIGQIEFLPGQPGATAALAHSFAAGDGLQILQAGGSSSTGGANMTLTVCLSELIV